MPELSEIEYSQEACVQAVRDYFHFLAQMYLDGTDFAEPPAGGWPDVTPENLAEVDKTDAVVDLLRRLPYVVQRTDGRDQIQVACFAEFTDWQESAALIAEGRYDGESLKTATEGGYLCDLVPPHVVGLTGGPRDSSIFLVDTALGIVLWPECPGEVSRGTPVRPVSDDAYDYEPDEEQAEWRGDSTAWAVPDFFEMLKDQFRRLEFVPISKTAVYVTHPYFHTPDRDMIPAVRDIYRRHHWPDLERYDKEACRAEIQAFLREQYPRYADS